MRKRQWVTLLMCGLMICGCASAQEQAPGSMQESSAASAAKTEQEKSGAGKRIATSLEEAVLKKNRNEQFVLMYTKEDCQYCAQFDEVLNPYLEEHPLTVYDVSLSEAEAMYSQEDLDTLLNILSAGVDRTPALYYVASQQQVNLLDHTETNYSLDGLEQWVEKYDLLRLE